MTNSFIGQVGDVTNHKQDFEKLHVLCVLLLFYFIFFAFFKTLVSWLRWEGGGVGWGGGILLRGGRK